MNRKKVKNQRTDITTYAEAVEYLEKVLDRWVSLKITHPYLIQALEIILQGKEKDNKK